MVKSNLSFTLIEIIVVTAIIAIVTSMGFANFHRQQSDEQLKSETRKMADMIGLARKKAMITDIAQCNNNDDRVRRYEFKIESTKIYKLYPQCIINPAPEIITYTIQSNDIEINSPAAGSIIFFYPRLIELTTATTINIKNNATNRCCQIEANAAGVIKEIPCTACAP